MKRKILNYLKEIVLFIVVITIMANVMSLYKSQDLNQQPLKFQYALLLDGSKYYFKEDKPLLIHFWATWCPTCKLEASNIDMIAKEYEVVTIAVKSGSNKEIKQFLEENNLSFKVVNDSKSLLASEFQLGAFPTTFIYDKEKKLIFSEVGYTSTLGLWLRLWWASF